MKTHLLEKNPFFLACKESRVESPVSLYGCFYLGSFHSGQSLTVANALRRTLLSELTGIAITSVQIAGAMHEYSTLNGVRESVLDILLNLKGVVLKIQTGSGFSNTESTLFQHPNIGYLKARGPGIVRARDLKLPASIQCVNPDQYLLTLCEDGSIDLKFRIYQGKNSILQNRLLNKKKKNSHVKAAAINDLNSTNLSLSRTNASLSSLEFEEWKPKSHLWRKQLEDQSFEQSSTITKTSQFVKNANFINIDSIFSPVNQVNYIIEENSPSNHLIILEIWTNGSIHPKQALFCGVKLLIKLFSRLETFRILDSSLIEAIFRTNQPEKKLSLGSSYFSEIESQQTKKSDLNALSDFSDSLIGNSSSQISNLEAALPLTSQKVIKGKTAPSLGLDTKGLKLNQPTVQGASIANKRESELRSYTPFFFPASSNQVLESSGLIQKEKPQNRQLSSLQISRPVKEKESNHLLSSNELGQFSNVLDKNKNYLLDIGTLNISLRAYTCLKRAHIDTIGQLIKFTGPELLQINNFGKRSLEEVENGLKQLNLCLK